MKKFFILITIIAATITSCDNYSKEEKIAMDYIKSNIHFPSTFKVLSTTRYDFHWESNSWIETNYFYNGLKSEGVITTDLRNGITYRKITYDSLAVIKHYADTSLATGVDVAFKTLNDYNKMVTGWAPVIIREGIARGYNEDREYCVRVSIVDSKKFDKPQIIKIQ